MCMNYEKIYNDLITDRINKKPQRLKEKRCGFYFEGHHIIPKWMGGGGNSNRPKNNPNIVLLTAREHFLAHWLLWRIHRNRPSALAFHKMISNNKNQNRKYSSNGYEEARIAFSETNKGNKYGVGVKRIVTDEQKLNHSKLMKGRYAGNNNPFFGKNHSIETLEKLKKPKSKEHIEKIRNIVKNRPKVKCPYCSKELDELNAKKWHFDNCLLNPTGHSRKATNFTKNNQYGNKSVIDLHSGIIYNSILDAAKYYNVCGGTITRWIKSNKNIAYFKNTE